MDTRERTTLELLCAEPPSAAIAALGSLADCLGLGVERSSFAAPLPTAPGIRGGALALDVAALAASADEVIEATVAAVRAERRHTLLLVTTADARCEQVLSRLTGGAVSRVVARQEALVIAFPARTSMHEVPLQGFSFERTRQPCLALGTTDEVSAQALMTLDNEPTFVRLRGDDAQRFVWATPEVLDASRAIGIESEFEQALDQYLPALAFLRDAFGPACWHSPVLAAGLVIDDPLLVRRYAGVDFARLLQSARNFGYRVTLAFIPWNHWRVGRRQASRFAAASDVFSVCIHGCDHTHHEFGGDDPDDLFARSLTGAERMKRLCERHRLPLEPVMVFPQEKYSHEAVRALARTGLYAAITNTRLIPTSGVGPATTAADLLTPAHDSLHAMPIFKRHYFTSMRDLALALFLGRPAIMACHHTDFVGGAAKAEAFAAGLNALGRPVQWLPLGAMVSRVHWRRWAAPDCLEIRLFGEALDFYSGIDRACTLRLCRRLAADRTVEAVFFDDAELAFERNGEVVAARVAHCAPGPHRLRILLARPEVQRRGLGSVHYQAAVAARRFFSELRDWAVAAVSNVRGVTYR